MSNIEVSDLKINPLDKKTLIEIARAMKESIDKEQNTLLLNLENLINVIKSTHKYTGS